MPRKGRHPEAELLADELDDALPVGSVPGERSCGPAELHRPAGISEPERGSCVEDTVEPACRLQPERDRYRLLEERPTHHRRVPMALRERGARRGDGVERPRDQLEGP